MSTGVKLVPATPFSVGQDGSEPGRFWPRGQHLLRYRYATSFAAGKSVIDIGCAAGYGTSLLYPSSRFVVGIEPLGELIESASGRFPEIEFLHANQDRLPICSRSLDLATAFESVVGYFDWPECAAEASRILAANGVFLASRAQADGQDQEELDAWLQVLRRNFRSVDVVLRDRLDGSLHPQGEQYAYPLPTAQKARFFVAVCSQVATEIPLRLSTSPASQILADELEELQNQRVTLTSLNGDLLEAFRDREHAYLEAAAELTDVKARLQASEQAAADSAAQLLEAESLLTVLVQERELALGSTWMQIGRFLRLGPWREPLTFRVLASDTQAFVVRTWATCGAPFLSLSERWSQLCETAPDLALYCLSPVLLVLSFLSLLAVDVCFALFGKRKLPVDTAPNHSAATVVIPNWNGRALLQRFLPSVVHALAGNPDNEIIVVDNASIDGSVGFIREQFPQIKVLRMRQNAGFGGACNAGVAAAQNDVVVLLNNDMRVEPGFLPPLLDKFSDPHLFAVSSQIFFSDPNRRREETGLTETWWENGQLGVTHHIDPAIREAFPCAYPGGGSSAVDKRKFLELGGFDELFRPFYYEDTDLGRLAWTRGWSILYEPNSVVHHEHRGTIGRRYKKDFVQGVIRKNALLYCWKNIGNWGMLFQHFRSCIGASLRSRTKPDKFKPVKENPCTPVQTAHCWKQLRQVWNSRWHARITRAISDKESFRRPLAGYYRDRFHPPIAEPARRLNVLFVSPYPIEPPVHGGAVFMREAIAELSEITNLHLISFVDSRSQLGAQERFRNICKSVKFLVRRGILLDDQWTLTPNAFREFESRELLWSIHRAIYREKIDVVQLEYTVLAQYFCNFRHIPCILFEHDISVQSLRSQIKASGWKGNLLLEWIRMRIHEPRLLKHFARVQVCSEANARYLASLVPQLRGRIDSDLRAGINLAGYRFLPEGREPESILFLGSFRHLPNLEGLRWFTTEIFPRILAQRPDAILYVAGSDPPAGVTLLNNHANIRFLGAVPDVRSVLERYRVFVCPILSGSGVRVKLLEAFASGIPAVSTYLGAEGLTSTTGEICELADDKQQFADSVVRLLSDSNYGKDLATRARTMVQQHRNVREMTRRLEQTYRHEVFRLQGTGKLGEGIPSDAHTLTY